MVSGSKLIDKRVCKKKKLHTFYITDKMNSFQEHAIIQIFRTQESLFCIWRRIQGNLQKR